MSSSHTPLWISSSVHCDYLRSHRSCRQNQTKSTILKIQWTKESFNILDVNKIMKLVIIRVSFYFSISFRLSDEVPTIMNVQLNYNECTTELTHLYSTLSNSLLLDSRKFCTPLLIIICLYELFIIITKTVYLSGLK